MKNLDDQDQWICSGRSIKHGFFTIKKDGGYCADPFFLTSDIVVYEFYSYEYRRGWIEAYDIKEAKSYKIFDNYMHCSFPFVFYYGEGIYIVPEQWRCKVLHALPIQFDHANHVKVNEKLAVRLSDKISVVDSMIAFNNEDLLCIFNEDDGFIGDPGGVLSMAKMDFATGGIDLANKHVVCADFRVSRNAGSFWIRDNEIRRLYQKKNFGSYGDGVGYHSFPLSPDRCQLSSLARFKDLKNKQINSKSHHLDLLKPNLGIVWDLKI